ncbi:MAG: endonuclease [Naasia sp.]|nr:endonuclease [Naasia sp.]
MQKPPDSEDWLFARPGSAVYELMLASAYQRTDGGDPDEESALDFAAADVRAVRDSLAHSAFMQRAQEAERLVTLAALHAAWNRANPERPARPGSISWRSLRASIALELQMSEPAAENLLALALTATTSLREALDRLAGGRITLRHLRALADNVADLDGEQTRELEQQALAVAEELPAGRFEQKLRLLRERIAPSGAVERRRKALEHRAVTVDAGRDGLAYLTLGGGIEQVAAAYDYASQLARHLGRGENETRTHTQLMADSLWDLILDQGAQAVVRDGDGALLADRTPLARGIVPTVLAAVPVLTMLGADDEPASLDGVIPIDIETARRLAGTAPSFIRLLTNPETGCVLSVGRDKYVPPAALRTYKQVQDGTCRFPGCARAARQCDLDHTQDWHFDGETAADNLGALCRGHHLLKHAGGWIVVQGPGGVFEWTSPLGTRHLDRPQFAPRGAPPGLRRRAGARPKAQAAWLDSPSDVPPF